MQKDLQNFVISRFEFQIRRSWRLIALTESFQIFLWETPLGFPTYSTHVASWFFVENHKLGFPLIVLLDFPCPFFFFSLTRVFSITVYRRNLIFGLKVGNGGSSERFFQIFEFRLRCRFAVQKAEFGPLKAKILTCDDFDLVFSLSCSNINVDLY